MAQREVILPFGPEIGEIKSGKDVGKAHVCRDCSLRKEIRLLRWQMKEQSEQIEQLTAHLMGVAP